MSDFYSVSSAGGTPAKPCNTNLTKIHMDFGIHGIFRGVKMRYAAF